MRNITRCSFIVLSFLFLWAAAPGWAEDMKFTTSYPSPYGIYQELSSTAKTSLATDSTAKTGIGTTTPTQKLDVVGSIAIPTTIDSTSGVIYKGTFRFIHNFALPGTDGANTFVGVNAGNFTMTGSTVEQGSYNTAVGWSALNRNTTGNYNTANGLQALYWNTTGWYNTASGIYALLGNTTGYQNTASGGSALAGNTTGYRNTASGAYALVKNSTGYQNTAQGFEALFSNTTGPYNSAMGVQAL